jgi:ubiquinone biosynthesis protein UbiJ
MSIGLGERTLGLPSRAFAQILEALVRRNDWAPARLQPFAGRTARIGVGALSFGLVVGEGGHLIASPATDEPAVRLDLPGDVWTRLPSGPQAVFGEVRITGDAAFAEALGFVLRNLRWDVEEDLARFVGDPLAHRLHGGALATAAWLRQAAGNTFANLREYAVEEAGVTPSREEMNAFGGDLAELRDGLARLSKRLDRLTR